jgi:transposase
MERIAMSQEERDWLEWMKRARDGKLTQREAAERMGVSERWVRKLLQRMKKRGDAVVLHGLRGRASNHKLPAKTQKEVLTILGHPDWHDFGPTFAAEQLAKHHQIQVGKETLRGWSAGPFICFYLQATPRIRQGHYRASCERLRLIQSCLGTMHSEVISHPTGPDLR